MSYFSMFRDQVDVLKWFAILDVLGKRKSSVGYEYEDRSGCECSQEYNRHSECPAAKKCNHHSEYLAVKEDVAPLFVLPACKKWPLTDSKLGLKDTRTSTKENLVDALISDLVCKFDI